MALLTPQNLSEALARTLRHEIGDFLQKVYASVAILQNRLPAAATQERDVLTRLRKRAETCKDLVDAIQDYLCPLSLAYETVDLAEVASREAAKAGQRFPHLTMVVEAVGPALAEVDPERVAQVAAALLTNAGEAARGQVSFRTAVVDQGGAVAWTVTDDGPGLAPELTGQLFNPFFTTRTGHAGLGLAIARKLVLLHGGRITAGNLPQQGFAATVILPSKASGSEKQEPKEVLPRAP